MISVIIVLYKTPFSKVRKLIQYKKFNLYIFEQEGSQKREIFLKKKLKFNFKYFYSEKNIGLSKAVNFLINKVNTKYCLMTEPDIEVSQKNIFVFEQVIKKSKDHIIVGPKYTNKQNKKKSNNKIFKIKKFIDPSCILFNVSLIRKIRFYDENFNFYWEDIDLMKRLERTGYKVVEMQNIYVYHEVSTSTTNSLKVMILKKMNFKFGELLFDFKHKKLRKIKIFRQLFQSLFFLIINIFLLNKKFIENLSYFLGINKFIYFLLLKKNL